MNTSALPSTAEYGINKPPTKPCTEASWSTFGAVISAVQHSNIIKLQDAWKNENSSMQCEESSTQTVEGE